MVQMAEPTMYPNIKRLEEEIRTKYANIDRALEIHAINRHRAKITDIRQEVSILQGMVYSWFYVSGRWNRTTSITLSHDVNNLAMYWLGVNIISLRHRAYGDKMTTNKPKPPRTRAKPNMHQYKPDYNKVGNPCIECGFASDHAWHGEE